MFGGRYGTFCTGGTYGSQVHNVVDLHAKQEYSVLGHVVEVEHSQVAHEVDVCFVSVDSKECYYVPVDCSVEDCSDSNEYHL